MAEPTLVSRRPFIEPDLRPHVGTHADGAHQSIGSGASAKEVSQVARQVLNDAGYMSMSRRWHPQEFLGRVMHATEDTQFTVLDDEAVLLNLNNGHYYTLNGMGTVIWDLLDGTRTLHAVLDVICERFEVGRDQAHDDLVALVMRMEREGLLHEERG
ncbi:MAG: PqqD family protein [Nitrospiraceae bacterium]